MTINSDNTPAVEPTPVSPKTKGTGRGRVATRGRGQKVAMDPTAVPGITGQTDPLPASPPPPPPIRSGLKARRPGPSQPGMLSAVHSPAAAPVQIPTAVPRLPEPVRQTQARQEDPASTPATAPSAAQSEEVREVTDPVEPRSRPAATASSTKADRVLKRLRSPRGATLQALMEDTGWQAHSVRGFLSGTVRKKRGLDLISDIGKDGVRRYRLAAQA